MVTKEKLILILLIISSFSSYSQNEYLDYIVTKKNDTIYGTMRRNLSDFVLFEKKPKFKKGGLKSISHNLNRMKTIRYNDKIYNFKKRDNSDGIYESSSINDTISKNTIETKLNKNYINIEEKSTDYIITLESDTLYGIISKPLIGKPYILTEKNAKIKIEKSKVLEYRFNNAVYNYIEIPNKLLIVNENDYLRLISNGKIKIYQLITNDSSNNFPLGNLNYFIIKDDEISHIHSLNYKKKLSEILIENQELVNKINENEYTLENMYLIGKFYNLN